MTDKSRRILIALANGIHPFKGYPLYENHFLNHPDVKRALNEVLVTKEKNSNFTNHTYNSDHDGTDNHFQPKCNLDPLFNDAEKDSLYEYGTWLDNLIDGKLEATSEDEKTFLEAARKLDMDANLEFKYKVYIKYLKRLSIINDPNYDKSMNVGTTIEDPWMSREDLKNWWKWR